MPVQVGPGISQAMAPDVMKGQRGGGKRRLLSARAFGQGRLQPGTVLNGQGCVRTRSFPRWRRSVTRAKGRSTITSSWNRPISLGYRASVPRWPPPRSTARRPRPLVRWGRGEVSHVRTLRIPTEQHLCMRGIPHQGKGIQPTVERAHSIDAAPEVAGSNAGQRQPSLTDSAPPDFGRLPHRE